MTFHIALSVDIDRFTDAVLRKKFCFPGSGIKFGGESRAPAVEEIRMACAMARMNGLRVFPPCDNTKLDGSCAGHPSEVKP